MHYPVCSLFKYFLIIEANRPTFRANGPDTLEIYNVHQYKIYVELYTIFICVSHYKFCDVFKL